METSCGIEFSLNRGGKCLIDPANASGPAGLEGECCDDVFVIGEGKDTRKGHFEAVVLVLAGFRNGEVEVSPVVVLVQIEFVSFGFVSLDNLL